LSPASMGQASPGSEAAAPAIDDWTYHHIIFSNPATAEQARRLEQDPRYRQQIRRQSPSAPEAEADAVLAPNLQAHTHGASNTPGLWQEDLGTGASIGAVNYPAKYSLTTATASCTTDFVVYPTGLPGAAGPGGQATIVAYNNLYSGCGGKVPSVYWAYYIGTGTTIQSSPVFSFDGTQLAFVQTDAGEASVVLLKWVASTTETVKKPTSVSLIGNYTSCHTPCRAELTLRDAGVPPSVTNSSIFYDYPSDTAFVGDDLGYLHKFNPVFNGTTSNPPAEVGGGIWPVQVNPGAPTALTSPVYDSVTGNVFVADKGGFLYRVNLSTAAVTVSGQLDVSNADDAGPGIVEGPILDYTANLVYVFATSDGRADCAGGLDCSAVWALGTAFTAGDIPATHAKVGISTAHGTAPSPMYIGAFDSTYENSTNATGNIYVCGNTGGKPTLYQVPLAAGVFGTVNAVTALSTATTPCSPITHIVNANATPPAELVFASVQASGTSTACAGGGCIYNSNIAPWQPATAYVVGQEILDSHSQIQVVETITGTGMSGAIVPTWSTAVAGTTGDNAVTWLNQGTIASTIALADWVKATPYVAGNVVIDKNLNIEYCLTGGTSAAGPTWKLTPGGVTKNGATLTWENLGANGTAALAETGGTSGIIIDNTVATGTEAGASQVYFMTLGSQTCTGGTGGCAVQASQSALQ
jgi:hypothetical protein